MSKYLVETFYTCTFKIVHKLDELNYKKLSELENRKDGEVQIIDVRLNNRKTKTTSKNDKPKSTQTNFNVKDTSSISSIINDKISSSDKTLDLKESSDKNPGIQKFNIKSGQLIFVFLSKKLHRRLS